MGVYLALEEVKRRQYKRWLEVDEEEKKAIELDPFAIAERAIMNCRPRMKLCVAVRGYLSIHSSLLLSNTFTIADRWDVDKLVDCYSTEALCHIIYEVL